MEVLKTVHTQKVMQKICVFNTTLNIEARIYYEELKKEDPDFYYSYTLHEFDRVENLFWVDGAARKSYELYSDCLSFDTTYLTNAYNMPCAPFIGMCEKN